MWDFPQDFDRDIQDMSQEIQREMTENVKKQTSTKVKQMKENALRIHNSGKMVYQAQIGEKRRSLMPGTEDVLFKRHQGDNTGIDVLCPRAQCARRKVNSKTGTLFPLSKSIGAFNVGIG